MGTWKVSKVNCRFTTDLLAVLMHIISIYLLSPPEPNYKCFILSFTVQLTLQLGSIVPPGVSLGHWEAETWEDTEDWSRRHRLVGWCPSSSSAHWLSTFYWFDWAVWVRGCWRRCSGTLHFLRSDTEEKITSCLSHPSPPPTSPSLTLSDQILPVSQRLVVTDHRHISQTTDEYLLIVLL